MTHWKRMIAGTAAATGLLIGGACGSGGSQEAFCEKSEELEDEGTLENLDVEDFDAFKEQFGDAEGQVNEVVDAAPDEIQDDAETIQEAYQNANDEVQDADSFEDLQDSEAFNDLNGDDVQEATENIEEYESENCDGGTDDTADTVEDVTVEDDTAT